MTSHWGMFTSQSMYYYSRSKRNLYVCPQITTYQTLLKSKMYDHFYFVVVGKKGKYMAIFLIKRKFYLPLLQKSGRHFNSLCEYL
jgi:hypothetical protein